MNTLTIPGYRIIKNIGRGGSAMVYLAEHQLLKRLVAVKVLHSQYTDDKDYLARFLREGQSIARLNHDNVLKVFDMNCHEGTYYIAMEYMPSGTLRHWIQQTKPSLEQLWSVFLTLLDVIAFIHKNGFVHRDIKPSNILFRQDGTPVLADFGLTRIVDCDKGLTNTRMVLGTPGYMSPEQLEGKLVDHRSDLYSVGVLMYELLTGTMPYCADSAYEVIANQLRLPTPKLPRPHRQYQPVLNRLLAKSPGDRFSSISALKMALSIIVEAVPAVDMTPKKTKKSWRKIALATTLVASLCLPLYGLTQNETPTINEAQIQQLLTLASEQIKSLRLTTPPGDNALTTLNQVLKAQPYNPRARIGLNQIVSRYVSLAQKTLSQGQYQQARVFVQKGLKVMPEHKVLLQLKSKINSH